jgi:hypothetical protein
VIYKDYGTIDVKTTIDVVKITGNAVIITTYLFD